jgi:hypothetical protein
MLLIPILQVASLLATLKLISRWRGQDPAQHPSRTPTWRRYGVLPFTANLLTALTLLPLLSKMRGFIKLFMPDFTWIALICGTTAGIWTFLQPILLLHFHNKHASEAHEWRVPTDGHTA